MTTERTQPFEDVSIYMYLLLKIMIFHRHVSFQGGIYHDFGGALLQRKASQHVPATFVGARHPAPKPAIHVVNKCSQDKQFAATSVLFLIKMNELTSIIASKKKYLVTIIWISVLNKSTSY